MKQEIIQKIPIEYLIPSKTNPRKIFNDSDMEELIKSIIEHGQLEPALVRPIKEKESTDGQYFEIVSGERRFNAILQINNSWGFSLKTMDAIVRNMSDQEVEEIQLIDHLQKAKITPMEESEAIQKLLKKNVSLDFICGKLSKSKSFILQRLKLLDLIPEIQDGINKDLIPSTFGNLISRETSEQQKEIYKWMDNGIKKRIPVNVSLPDLKEFIESFHLNLSSAPFKWKDPELDPVAGSCEACPKRSGTIPDLFNDIKSDSICLDSKCFKNKTRLHIEKRLNEDPSLVKLSTRYYIAPKLKKEDVIGKEYYHEKDSPMYNKNKLKAKKGIIIDGHWFINNNIGSEISIVLNSDCSRDKEDRIYSVPTSLEKRKKAVLVKRRSEANFLILEEIGNNFIKRMNDNTFQDLFTDNEKEKIMMEAFSSIGHDNHVFYFRHLDQDIDKNSFNQKNYITTFKKLYNEKSKALKEIFLKWYYSTLIKFTFIHGIHASEYNPSAGGELRKIAKKDYKINVAKIDGEILKKYPAPVLKKAADKKKTKKTSGKKLSSGKNIKAASKKSMVKK